MERRIGRRPQQRGLARGGERPRLQGQGPFLDLRQRPQDEWRREWHDPGRAPIEAALRVEAPCPLRVHDLARSIDGPRHGLNGRADDEDRAPTHSPPRQVGQQVVDRRGQVDETDREGEGQEPGRRLEAEAEAAPRGRERPKSDDRVARTRQQEQIDDHDRGHDRSGGQGDQARESESMRGGGADRDDGEDRERAEPARDQERGHDLENGDGELGAGVQRSVEAGRTPGHEVGQAGGFGQS